MATKDQHANTIKSAILDACVHCHGRPNIAVSDHAQNVNGEVINELCVSSWESRNIDLPFTIPKGDSQAERSVQTVKALIRCISAEEGVPKYARLTILQQVAFLHNSSVSTSTNYTLYELMFGDEPKLPPKKCSPDMDKEIGVDIDSKAEKRRHQVKQKWSEAASQLEHAKQVYKRSYDIGCKEKQVRVGDYVYIKDHKRKTALDPLFIGLFRAVVFNVHTVQNLDPTREIRTIHLNNCQVYTQSQVVILPAADGADLELIKESDEDQSMPDTEEIVTADGGANPCLTLPALEDLSLPIALRKLERHKPKDFGPDFVSS